MPLEYILNESPFNVSLFLGTLYASLFCMFIDIFLNIYLKTKLFLTKHSPFCHASFKPTSREPYKTPYQKMMDVCHRQNGC